MARKPKEVVKHDPLPEPQSTADVITEGDYAGYSYDEVMALTSAAIDDAYADLSIQGVCAVHDMKLGEILEIVRVYEGTASAHEAAIRFGMTIMPYLATPTPKLKKSYRELIGHNGGPKIDDEEE